MADQMSCMGFAFDAPDDVQRFFDAHWANKAVIDMDRGVYLRMNAAEDIVCWISVAPDTQEVLDWDMHYGAAAAMGCAFDCDLSMDEAGQSGYIRVLLNPGTDHELPLTAACPALAFWPDREAGSPGLIRPAFYALSVDESEEDESLIADPDHSLAAVTGRVISAERKRNKWSARDYWHISLACRGLTLDLLCAEETFSAVPLNGTVLSCKACVTAEVEAGVIR